MDAWANKAKSVSSDANVAEECYKQPKLSDAVFVEDWIHSDTTFPPLLSRSRFPFTPTALKWRKTPQKALSHWQNGTKASPALDTLTKPNLQTGNHIISGAEKLPYYAQIIHQEESCILEKLQFGHKVFLSSSNKIQLKKLQLTKLIKLIKFRFQVFSLK